MKANIHHRPTMIIAFHAENMSDREQAAAYGRLADAIPYDAAYDYVWLGDMNNIPSPTKDISNNYTSRPWRQDRQRGVYSLFRCARKWGGLADAYRTLHPDGRAYTRRNVIRRAQPGRSAQVSYKRIDRAMLSPHLLHSTSLPHVRSVQHLKPSDLELAAVRRLGSKTRWSDHCALQFTMQYTATPRGKPKWTVPRYLLTDPEFVNKTLRPMVTQEASEPGLGMERLTSLLANARKTLRDRAKADTKATAKSLHILHAQLSETHRLVGDGFGNGGELYETQQATGTANAYFHRWRIQHALRRQSDLQDMLLRIHDKKRRKWAINRGYDDYRTADTCCREFFEDTRKTLTFSYIEHVRVPVAGHPQRVRSHKGLFRAARNHFCGAGAIFNLASGTQEVPAARAHKCKAALLDAIVADGKVLSPEQATALHTDSIFTPEAIQTAIDGLPAHTSPGSDGFVAEYFKTVGRRDEKVDPTTGVKTLVPSPLAHLITAAFVDSITVQQRLPRDMVTAVVSLIYKNKGMRNDLSKYRPIAVSSVLYRILARTLVGAISPLLHTLSSPCQKAFKPHDIIGDATRLVQDTIHYCAHTGTPGFLVFADQDNAYPRVRWEYLFQVMRTMNIPQSFIDIV
ncbi:MAG: hypothetical protein GY813_05625, partial [Halieaceae bacterium]|nr:hypothetical protein [Halieaceae bacterium]